MIYVTTESNFNHWLNKKYFTAVLLCLFAVCCSGFNAIAATSKFIPKTKTAKFAAPVITSFAPKQGTTGSLIKISGTNLGDVTTLTIGSKAALIISQTDTSVTVMVMPGSIRGSLTATNGSGSMTTAGTFWPNDVVPPTIMQSDPVGYLEGQNIALSSDGNTMAVKGAEMTYTGGVPNHSPHPSDATVYKRHKRIWSVYAEITGDIFQLNADGKILMNRTGIYADNGSGAFVLQYTFPVASASGFSISLSADGRLAVVGNGGIVYTYKNTNGTWAPSGSSITRASHNNTFGYGLSLSADGKTVLVTDRFLQPANSSDSPGAWVYTRNADNWIAETPLPTYDKDYKGTSGDNRQAINADGNRIILNSRVYNRTDNQWSFMVKLSDSGPVSLSADGKIAMFAISRIFTHEYYTPTGLRVDYSTGPGISVYRETNNSWNRLYQVWRSASQTDYDKIGTVFGVLSADGSTAVVGCYGSWNSGVGVFYNRLPISAKAVLPASGPAGTIIKISSNVDYPVYKTFSTTGVKQFSIGGKPGIIISNDGDDILGMVAPGTVSGPISFKDEDGDIINTPVIFNVTPSPAIPTTGSSKFGTAVTSGNTDIYQGYSVAISANGTTAVVGAPNYANGKGALIIFTRPGYAAGTWTQQGPVLVNPYGGPALGVSVAISADGNTVIGGGRKMPNTKTGFLSKGAATVLFNRNANSWTAAGDFGLSDAVALSADGNVAVLGTVEKNSDLNLASNAVLKAFAQQSVGAGYKAYPPQYIGAADFISLAFSVSRTLVIGKPQQYTTPGQGGTTSYGSAMVKYNMNDQGYFIEGGANLKSTRYGGQGYEGSVIAISSDERVIISGGVANDAVTFIRADTGWVEGPTLPNAGKAVSLNADGTLALIITEEGATFYKFNGSAWVKQGAALPGTKGLSAVALPPDGSRAFLGFAYDPNGGAAQVFDDAITNITYFSPASGPTGTIVTINGSGFNGLSPMISGKPAVVLSATNTKLKIMVTATTSGKITFKENSFTSSGGNFTVTPLPLPTNLQTAKLGLAEGSSIALSADGNTMVVQKLTTLPTLSSDHADTSMVYKRKANGTWYKYAKLLVTANSHGGYRINADGSTILSSDGIFGDNGDGTYTRQLALTMSPNFIDGSVLSAGGDVAIVPNTTNGTDFSLTPYIRTNDTWQQGTSFTKAGRKLFGSVLALSADGSTLLVGDFGDKNIANDSLGVYVYYRSGNNFYTFLKLPSRVNGPAIQPVFGVSTDGNTIIVNIVAGGVNNLAPAIYTRSGGTWVKAGYFPSDGNTTCSNCYAGISFSADGNTVLAGNRLYKGSGSNWSLAAVLDNTFTDVGGKKATPGPRSDQIPYFSTLSADGSTAVLGQMAYYDSGVKVFTSTVASPSVAPTMSATKLVFTNITSNSTTVSWTKGNGARRTVFIAKTANGVAAPVNDTTYIPNTAFGVGKQIGATGWYAVYNGDGNSVNITGLASSATYRVTVVESNGVDGDEKYLLTNLAPASVVTALSPNDPPTVQASALNFINTTSSTTTVRWTNGNGNARAVFVAKTANGVAAPVDDNIYPYNATSIFGHGAQIGSTGWYCIYNGTGNSADISGLSASSTYRVTVVEYNASGSLIRYMNTKLAPASVVTLTSPTATPTTPSLKLTFANIAATSTTVNWISGNGSRRAVFVARRADGVAAPTDNTTYSANANFAAGTQIGTTGWYCVYDGTGSTANISGLTPGTTYRVTVVDYNGTAGNQKYMNTRLAPASIATAATSPTIPSLKLTFTNTTTSTTNVSWISGNGALRAVFVARTANGVANAVNNTTYTANQSFGAGTQIGSTGWYCVYNGNGSNTNITGLVANTIYRVTVIEYNGGSGTQLYTNDKLNPAIVTTIPAGTVPPTGPSLSLNFSNTTSTATTVNWNSGNGARRAVFVARRADGVAAPTDNTTYTGNPTFAAGTQVGATGWYCVYDGTGSSADITGLTAGTVYRVTVVDYNGAPGTEKYMNTRLAPASIITATGSGLRLAFTSLKSDTPADELALSEIEASNLLSPNGDGKNDTWMVKNIERYQNNSVTVYDQGSNVVYTKKGYTNDWAGTYRGGVVKEGTYYYLIDLGDGTTKKGFITVLSSRQ